MIFRILITFLIIFTSASASKNCPEYKAVVCHAGSEQNPHFVEICVSFSSLYGHLAEHSQDYYGECSLKNVKASYACNAGMRHKDVEDEVCIKKDNNFEVVVDNCDNSLNCTCSAKENLYKSDYFDVEVSSFEPFTELTFNTERMSKMAGKDLYKVATTDPRNTRISSENGLAFFLGSERMNAEYFVDMCWTNTTGLVDFNLNFEFLSQIETNLFDTISYPIVSGLHSKLSLYCDKEFDGISNYSTATLVNATDYSPFSSSQIVNFDFGVQNSEFCFLRQSFIEIYPTVTRPYELKKITVLNNIESLEKKPIDRPIEICHINEISKGGGNGTNNSYSSQIDIVRVDLPFITEDKNKIYECSNLRFLNSDHLKQYISSGKDSKDFRDIHQHDYVGICNNICGPIHGNGAN